MRFWIIVGVGLHVALSRPELWNHTYPIGLYIFVIIAVISALILDLR